MIFNKNKEKLYFKKIICQNNREKFRDYNKNNIDNRHLMQQKDRIKTIFKIYYKRKTFSQIIKMNYILKNLKKKDKLNFQKCKTFHSNKCIKINCYKMN